MILLSRFGLLLFAFMALAPGRLLADEQVQLSVASLRDFQYLDDFFKFEVAVENRTDKEVRFVLPDRASGVTPTIDIEFSVPAGWEMRSPRGRDRAGESGGYAESGVARFLILRPRSQGRFVVDLRDYFERIDLSNSRVEIRINAVVEFEQRSELDKPSYTHFSWSGEHDILVGQSKDVEIRF